MANVQKISVALTPEMIGMLKEAVEVGDYTSTSEVIRDALREWKSRRAGRDLELEDLRRLWREGLDSGPSLDAETVFGRLSDKYRGDKGE
ncbi:antitoxin ParD1/3/4 [Rhodoblastus acidophilus]|uniref:type II toxin-antitoxin system ParD family antitoxin n=1 Tax=Rhodoblastus acidophilus TaxID=1074 RepID=UPI00222582F2|nr:type II toxin-antitoxin system ParD family antitoxin [Rhodoblastus acidophilus]MCW2317383.1 antitoxin ParD1/3/4 [Rhodoblastus acidophilus]